MEVRALNSAAVRVDTFLGTERRHPKDARCEAAELLSSVHE